MQQQHINIRDDNNCNISSQTAHTENLSKSLLNQYNNLNQTPVSKNNNAFKSPAPSSKKYLSVHNIKSPGVSNHGKNGMSNSKHHQNQTDSWMISPVCSRLREHIQMMNGYAQKERLFLHSPMTNQMAWPLASPAINNMRGIAQVSTAPNTSTCQKYVTNNTQEAFSDAKVIEGVDSPLVIRKFNDHEINQTGLLCTLNKNHQQSDSKNQQEQHWKNIQDYIPYNFDEVCFRLENQADQNKLNSLQGSNRKDIQVLKLPNSGNMAFKLNLAQSHQPQPSNSINQMVFYKMEDDMNEDSYSSDNMDNDNDSESLQQQVSDNMKNCKKLISRCYSGQDSANYERIIRKRKRKSTDQLKILMREFDRNPNWSKETLLEVSRKTGLSEAQVYKWGWDQKRKKYGPEIAAMMMVPFDQMDFQDSYQPSQFIDYEALQMQGQGNNFKQLIQENNHSSKRQGFSHIPFPNESLLDQLSNQLAHEESITQNQLNISKQEQNQAKKTLSSEKPAELRVKSALKRTLDSSKSSKNQPRITVENNEDQVRVRIQLDSNEKNHKSGNKNHHSTLKINPDSQKNDSLLINTPANDHAGEKKRQLKAESKEKSRLHKHSDENKENGKAYAPVLNLNKDLNKISLERDQRKTRSGKTVQINPSKILEDCTPEPILQNDKKKLREQRVLRKINNR